MSNRAVKMAKSKPMTPRFCCLLVAGWGLAGCLDPLYEDNGLGGPGTKYGVCCSAGRVSTCACPSDMSCNYPLLACAGGRCVPAPGGQPQGSCGGADSGTPFDGGTAFDSGTAEDGGVVRLDGGTAESYAPCCLFGRVDTCLCTNGKCPPFTPCARGTCIAGTTTGVCGP